MAPVRTELPRAGRCSWTPNMAPVTAPQLRISSSIPRRRYMPSPWTLLRYRAEAARPTTLLPPPDPPREHQESPGHPPQCCPESHYARGNCCLLYTSDAADDLLCVDL